MGPILASAGSERTIQAKKVQALTRVREHGAHSVIGQSQLQA
jgi:hypothetical protein